MVLALNGVKKTFAGPEGPVPVLSGIDLTLDPGETLALTGESGSGKSTLLHIAGALETADAGEIAIDGTRLSQLDDRGRAALRRETIGIVFQQFNLIPSLDVAANIDFQARVAGRHDPARSARLAEALGLGPQLRKYPEQLSGGQQQRVAIARALAGAPSLVLADEPTGNLDEGTAADVLAEMRGLVTEAGAALMIVTHSSTIAAQMDRRLNLHDGRLQ